MIKKALNLDFTIILRWGFGALLLIDGVDKFFNLVAFWPDYLAPLAIEIIPISSQTFMYFIGVIEIIVALTVLVMPEIGLIMAGLLFWGIAFNLILGQRFYNIVLIDIMLGLSAFHVRQKLAERK